jgi:hypothetical protein
LLLIDDLYSESNAFDAASTLPFHDFADHEFIVVDTLLHFDLDIAFGLFG